MLWNVPAICTAILGTVYTAITFACVRNGSVTAQSACALLPSDSGTRATTSQLFVELRPVLMPPCSRTPFCSRALTLTSTPFQC